MKIYEIVGVKKNSGVIKATEKAWENYELYCTVESDKLLKDLTGKTVETVKVSQIVMKNFCDEVGTSFIGIKVSFEFELREYNGVAKIVTTDIIPIE